MDREQLIRAFVNILSNAVEYTPAKGTVFFDVNEKDNAILFSITDTGSGFSSEALKRATEQFYMDDQSRNSKSHYGIGLYVVNSIVSQHGGQLILSNSEKLAAHRSQSQFHIDFKGGLKPPFFKSL